MPLSYVQKLETYNSTQFSVYCLTHHRAYPPAFKEMNVAKATWVSKLLHNCKKMTSNTWHFQTLHSTKIKYLLTYPVSETPVHTYKIDSDLINGTMSNR